jgi:hypothetical protein
MTNQIEVRKLRIEGQSIIEYIIIFGLVAVASVALLPKVNTIFANYTKNATEIMTGAK